MLATSARVVPHIIRAGAEVPRGAIATLLPSTLASTLSVSSSDSSPSLPFGESTTSERNLHARRNLDRILAYARHLPRLLRTRGRGLRRQHWQRAPRHRSAP